MAGETVTVVNFWPKRLYMGQWIPEAFDILTLVDKLWCVIWLSTLNTRVRICAKWLSEADRRVGLNPGLRCLTYWRCDVQASADLCIVWRRS